MNSNWQFMTVKLVFLFIVMIFKHLNLKLFTVMTVQDRVKETFESTVLQKLCVGFLQGFITSQACPGQACGGGGRGRLNFHFDICMWSKGSKKGSSAKFGAWFFVHFEALETETCPNVRHKNWTFLQFWGFEMQTFHKFVISGECRILRN